MAQPDGLQQPGHGYLRMTPRRDGRPFAFDPADADQNELVLQELDQELSDEMHAFRTGKPLGTVRSPRPSPTPRPPTAATKEDTLQTVQRPVAAIVQPETVSSNKSLRFSEEAEGGGDTSHQYFGGFSFGKQKEDHEHDLDAAPSEQSLVPHPPTTDKYKSARRRTVMSEAVKDADAEAWKPVAYPKTAEETASLIKILSSLVTFAHLDDREVAVAADAFFRKELAAGESVIQEGEWPGDRGDDWGDFFVIASGTAEVHTSDCPEPVPLQAGQHFGEMELLHLEPRRATVVATSPLVLWAMDRSTYRHLLTQTFLKKRNLYCAFLEKVGFLSSLSRQELVQIADCLQPVVYSAGEHLIRYGEEGTWMYMIVEGEVEVIGRDDEGKPSHVCFFTVGDIVGELEFIHNHRTVADIKATGPLRAARLHRPHFELCMGPVKEVLARNAAENAKYAYYQHQQQRLHSASSNPVDVSDDTVAISAWENVVQHFHEISSHCSNVSSSLVAEGLQLSMDDRNYTLTLQRDGTFKEYHSGNTLQATASALQFQAAQQRLILLGEGGFKHCIQLAPAE